VAHREDKQVFNHRKTKVGRKKEKKKVARKVGYGAVESE